MKKRNVGKDIDALEKTLKSFNETLDSATVQMGGTPQEKVKYPLFVEGSDCLVHFNDGFYLDTAHKVNSHTILLSDGSVVHRSTVHNPLESEEIVEVYKLLKEAKERYPVGTFIRGNPIKIDGDYKFMYWNDNRGLRICCDNRTLYSFSSWAETYTPIKKTFWDKLKRRF